MEMSLDKLEMSPGSRVRVKKIILIRFYFS